MSEVTDVVLRMLNDVFNERDATRRQAAIDEVFAPDVVFTDPEATVSGREAVAAKIEGLLADAPGLVFRLAAPVQEVADLGLDHWQLGPADGAPVVSGVDVAFVREGKIVRLYTMIDSA
jgi:hypothetical protein